MMEPNNNEQRKEEKPSCCERFRTKMRNLGHFIWNSETKEVLGRTGISWLQILSFYIGVYAFIAAFWACCLAVFIRTLDPNVPTMQKMYSMMKDNPGMNFEPFFPADSSTLISFDPNDNTTYQKYVDQIKSVLEVYSNRSKSPEKYNNCQGGQSGATAEKGCMFDLASLGTSCTDSTTDFGYKIGKPCVFLRINRVFDWDPRNRTFDDEKRCNKDKDKDNPECTKHVEFLNITKNMRSEIVPDYVAVSCQGENDGDVDNIKNVTFFPAAGYPTYFFPFFKQDGYTSPIVAAQFDVKYGRVSMILCKFWTRDVIHDKADLQGSIHFELMISPKNNTF